MKNIILSLVALTFVACELSFSVNDTNATLSEITIECISETTISNNTSANEPFTRHTYLCRGYVENISGECSIKVLHNNFIVHNNHNLVVAGKKMPFEFTFAPEWGYLDNQNNTFTVQLYVEDDVPVCQTTVVVTKHPEDQNAELSDVPYLEYSLWGTRCEWQLPSDNSLIVVNNDEELSRYITSTSGESYPAIDFSRYTMIIAHGGTPQGIRQITIESLKQLSEVEYILNITVAMTMTDAPELWTKALLVDKWDKLCKVNLNVEIIESLN